MLKAEKNNAKFATDSRLTRVQELKQASFTKHFFFIVLIILGLQVLQVV